MDCISKQLDGETTRHDVHYTHQQAGIRPTLNFMVSAAFECAGAEGGFNGNDRCSACKGVQRDTYQQASDATEPLNTVHVSAIPHPCEHSYLAVPLNDTGPLADVFRCIVVRH